MRAAAVVAIALMLLACAADRIQHAEASAARAEARLDATDRTYALSEAEMREMKALANELEHRTARARDHWLAAENDFREASVRALEASTTFRQAEKDYLAAADGYRRMTTMIILAAASDLFLRGVCGPRVSTAKYRRELKAAGIDLRGKDIDHLIARARGGPDRPWNYMPLESSINRSLGAGGLGWKLANMPLETLNALAKNASYQLLCD